MSLPHPEKARWQPLRCGLVDLFHYDYQEFHFRDGRLLLRGNNGTGKSKVLALTLPFLLDANITAARVEPDGDAKKRMEWNLLMAGRYNERVGYSWLEFGRLDEAGEAEFCTVGCGLKAVKGKPVESWFFVTPQRVGAGEEGRLSLLENRRALSRDRLKERLGAEGALYREAKRYRQAVDERIFRLGEERYKALIDLLIQLRQPQLSKKPDERALSRALTEALPPLSGAMLGDVAAAFRNLEEERAALEGLEAAREAVEGFRGHHRGYARSACRRRAGRVREVQREVEASETALGGAREALAAAEAGAARAAGEREAVRHDQERARVEEQTLRDSPEMRDARRLRDVEQRAGERAAVARREEEELARVAVEAERRGRERAVLGRRLEGGRVVVRNGIAGMAEAAVQLAIEAEHRALLEPLALPDGEGHGEAAIAAARRRQQGLIERRNEQIDYLERLTRAVEEAERRHEADHRAWQEAETRAAALAEERLEADAAVAAAGEALVGAFTTWCDGLEEMAIADPEALAGELEEWAESLEGESPARRALHHAHGRAAETLAEARVCAEQALRETGEALRALDGERERLEAGEEGAPPVPYTRGEGVREGRAGAPLWRLVDFREGVAAATRAAVEAALEDAGLLDAWVEPDGALLAPGRWERIALPVGEVAANLSTVLVPSVDREDAAAAGVSDGTVARLLAAIGWGEGAGAAWIDGDGRWRLGPLHGAWGKPRAEYLGRGAREAARRRRLRELAEAIAAAQARLGEQQAELERLAARRDALEAERRRAPDEEPLREVHRRAAEAARRQALQREEVARRLAVLDEARQRLEGRREEALIAAEELSLPGEPAALAAARRRLGDYATAAAAFWPELRNHWEGLERDRGLHRELDEITARRERRAAEAERAARDAREAQAEAATLRATVGAGAAEVERRLAEAQASLRRLERRQEALDKEYVEQREAAAEARSRVAGLETQRAGLERERVTAVDGLRQLATLGLIYAAFPEMARLARPEKWSVSDGVSLARGLERQLRGVKHGDENWNELQKRLQEQVTELQSTLSRYGHEATTEPVDELLVVRVVFHARPCDVEELIGLLRGEIADRCALLDERERKLLEHHLIDDVAGHLQGMILEADGLVARMNGELESRPTSTGMKLRLKWRALKDGEEWENRTAPTGLAEARRRLLRQEAGMWSEEERAAVGAFLKTRIDDARAADEGGTLQEVLARALDYRHWHRFEVERWQDGQWRPAYGPASGGERALVVTIPLFAAASSHYTSAGAHAPRLVLLDEAFAGVDDDSRAKCLGLLAQFDMDVVMTSEREWGCYAEVPGLAIAQLTRHEEIDAVHVSHWWWNGRRRQRGEEPPDFEGVA
ncbi:TIGR02680 family protein [Endothiovibrio diazotrophicus]